MMDRVCNCTIDENHNCESDSMTTPTGEQDKRTFSKVDMIEFGKFALELEYIVTEDEWEYVLDNFIKQREDGKD